MPDASDTCLFKEPELLDILASQDSTRTASAPTGRPPRAPHHPIAAKAGPDDPSARSH